MTKILFFYFLLLISEIKGEKDWWDVDQRIFESGKKFRVS